MSLMARETSLRPGLLFLLSASLLTAGWLMKSFPVFMFAGLAPLFGILDNIDDDDRFWNLSELVLASLGIGFFAAHLFDAGTVVVSLAQAILMTTAFLAASLVRQTAGLGNFTVIFFWITLEWLLALLPWRHSILYLGDSLALKPEWFRWTALTGYAGVSLWVLIVNYLVYLSFLTGRNRRWLTAVTILCIAGPLVISYFSQEAVISRLDMIARYDKMRTVREFFSQSEILHRAAGFMSGVLLSAGIIRNQFQK